MTYVQVCRDPRWGRCYESYSEDHKIVQAMTEIIPGLQGEIPSNFIKGAPYVSGKYEFPIFYFFNHKLKPLVIPTVLKMRLALIANYSILYFFDFIN